MLGMGYYMEQRWGSELASVLFGSQIRQEHALNILFR